MALSKFQFSNCMQSQISNFYIFISFTKCKMFLNTVLNNSLQIYPCLYTTSHLNQLLLSLMGQYQTFENVMICMNAVNISILSPYFVWLLGFPAYSWVGGRPVYLTTTFRMQGPQTSVSFPVNMSFTAL